ncbi:uncharacterized protein LOC128597111 isoform X2 [Nycticebus coucang]|uniref:uncharacterized protein LOC128597111 isoform X2 n=1 Tax=Nycticebus coucang TaxID=9470 RepID=UPI00234D2D0D|nr:uncharacterized protein LOC128597111 isoform X2 [Nycticebus coucang]
MGSSGSSCLPTLVLVLQISFSLGFRSIVGSSPSCTLNSTVGTSVQLQLSSTLGPNVREIEWKWDSKYKKRQLLLSWQLNNSNPYWYEFKDKYKYRFHLTEMASLCIRNVSTEMSGLYTVTIKFYSGESKEESFRLCVYEPIPHPEILIHSSSNTLGWCNVSLECGTLGVTENLTVTWLSNNLFRELEQRGTLVPDPNSRNLSLSLPLRQFNGHLTCVISNPVDQKNTTLDLDTICLWRGSPSKWLLISILAFVLMMSLGAGVWIWKRKKRKAERVPGPAAASQSLSTENYADLQTGEVDSHDSIYPEIGLLSHPKSNVEKRSFHAQGPEPVPEVYTVYEKIRPHLEEDA